jgi:ABC-type multidrug transport system fused ATPase/permease subunit
LNRIKALAFYKRSVFLINPKFQLKFSFVVSSIVVISTIIYPLIIYDFFQMVGPKFNDARNELIFFLIFIQTIISLLVFIAFIFFTHKIAGPMFKLKNHLSAIREGHEITPLTFRNGDYFPDVAEEVSLFLETVSNNQENDFQYVEEISAYLENLSTVVPDDKKPILNEISRRLLDIKSRYKKSL